MTHSKKKNKGAKHLIPENKFDIPVLVGPIRMKQLEESAKNYKPEK
jgi:hypothetical protein